MGSEEPRKAGFFRWAAFGFANVDKHDIIKCDICGSDFDSRYPKAGESVICPHCGAGGHSTHDEGGNYTLRWYENEGNWS